MPKRKNNKKAPGAVIVQVAPQTKKKRTRKMKSMSTNGTRRITAPSAMSTMTQRQPPRIVSSSKGDGSMRISHREYVYDVDSTIFTGTGFQVATLPLLANPAYVSPATSPKFQTLFPWLNTIAKRFDQYKVRSMTLIYSPLTGTGTSGKIYLAAVPDVKQDRPTSKAQFLEQEHAVSCPVWGVAGGEVRYVIPRDFYTDRREKLFLRQDDTVYAGATVSSAVDLLNYDFCQLFVAVSSPPVSPAVYGEILIEYDIELFHPVESTSLAAVPCPVYYPMGEAYIASFAAGTLPTLAGMGAPVYSAAGLPGSTAAFAFDLTLMSFILNCQASVLPFLPDDAYRYEVTFTFPVALVALLLPNGNYWTSSTSTNIGAVGFFHQQPPAISKFGGIAELRFAFTITLTPAVLGASFGLDLHADPTWVAYLTGLCNANPYDCKIAFTELIGDDPTMRKARTGMKLTHADKLFNLAKSVQNPNTPDGKFILV